MNNNRTISSLAIAFLFALLIACTENEDIREPDLPDELSKYVDIPDENFERKLITLGIDSRGSDDCHSA